MRGLLKFTQLLIHRLIGSDGGWGLSSEVAEDPVFKDGVDQDGEGSDEQGVEIAVFGDAKVSGGASEDDFPAVGGVKADEGIGE